MLGVGAVYVESQQEREGGGEGERRRVWARVAGGVSHLDTLGAVLGDCGTLRQAARSVLEWRVHGSGHLVYTVVGTGCARQWAPGLQESGHLCIVHLLGSAAVESRREQPARPDRHRRELGLGCGRVQRAACDTDGGSLRCMRLQPTLHAAACGCSLRCTAAAACDACGCSLLLQCVQLEAAAGCRRPHRPARTRVAGWWPRASSRSCRWD